MESRQWERCESSSPAVRGRGTSFAPEGALVFFRSLPLVRDLRREVRVKTLTYRALIYRALIYLCRPSGLRDFVPRQGSLGSARDKFRPDLPLSSLRDLGLSSLVRAPSALLGTSSAQG